MRLGSCLLFEGRTLQGARAQLADFCSAPMADFYAAVDKVGTKNGLKVFTREIGLELPQRNDG